MIPATRTVGNLSVQENLDIALKFSAVPKNKHKARIAELLELVGLSNFEKLRQRNSVAAKIGMVAIYVFLCFLQIVPRVLKMNKLSIYQQYLRVRAGV